MRDYIYLYSFVCSNVRNDKLDHVLLHDRDDEPLHELAMGHHQRQRKLSWNLVSRRLVFRKHRPFINCTPYFATKP